MKDVTIAFDSRDKKVLPFLQELEQAKGLGPAEIGRLMAKKLKKNEKTQAALYSFFRRGQRKISKSSLPVLAEIFGIPVTELRKMNAGPGTAKVLQLRLPHDTLAKAIIESIRLSDSMTIGQFLIELHLACERGVLKEKLV